MSERVDLHVFEERRAECDITFDLKVFSAYCHGKSDVKSSKKF